MQKSDLSEAQKIAAYKVQKEANELQQIAEMNRIRALNTKDAIYFNFSYTALKLLGKNLYNNPWTAIAELVANGIDAKATEVYVCIDVADKKHATVEIIDNGIGMNYDELAEKYVWIGRNKREDDIFSDDEKITVMGRKGIGKLAALYLTSQYYIISKKENTKTANQWGLNVHKYRDSDFPRLDKIDHQIELKTKKLFDSFKNGTAIKLVDVNLQGMGNKTVDGMKRTLADFYLLDNVGSKIYFSIIERKNQSVLFEPIEKKIAYKNFYAVFENGDADIWGKMKDFLYFPSSIDFISKKERPTKRISIDKFITSGEDTFTNDEGTSFVKQFELKGWIGIHSTIKQTEAQKNDSNFMRRDEIYNPNQLRLYVRNKLAVSNFLTVIESSQAMANYIEGEICFDILDDNDLPDIATSNRQSFLDDKRVKILKDLINPILTKLFAERNQVGREVSKEEEDYKAEEKRQIEEAAARAEQERQDAERRQQEAETARIKAEIEKEEAQKALDIAKTKLTGEKKRGDYLTSVLTEDVENFAKKIHMIRINNDSIEKAIDFLINKNRLKKITIEDVWDSIKSISYCNERIKSLLDYSPFAQFKTEDESIPEGDLFLFIKQYCDVVSSRGLIDDNLQMTLTTKLLTDCFYIRNFVPQDIGVVIENIISNSGKHNAKNICFNMYSNENSYCIDCIDDGDGLKEGIDLNEIFEFGKSYTKRGTGVGLYHVKQIIEGMDGNICVDVNAKKGFILQVRFDK